MLKKIQIFNQNKKIYMQEKEYDLLEDITEKYAPS